MEKIFKDQLSNKITVNFPPRRIISLVPSQTELLFDLGLDEEISGVTKFCIHPREKCRTRAIVGGTKNFDFEKIDSLKPDLILANKEENYKEGIEILQKNYPVWISDINNINDCCDMIKSIAAITGKTETGVKIFNNINDSVTSLKTEKKYTVAYLIWKDPYMTVGSDTFIHSMLELAGFENIFSDHTRYPVITKDDLTDKNPDLIFLSSEPYPFKEKHLDEFKRINKSSEIILVDGEMFSWHGSRMQYAAEYYTKLRKMIADLY
jgi:ABC-type Fe3+-hydroxamate transport system substrate-binding protein